MAPKQDLREAGAQLRAYAKTPGIRQIDRELCELHASIFSLQVGEPAYYARLALRTMAKTVREAA